MPYIHTDFEYLRRFVPRTWDDGPLKDRLAKRKPDPAAAQAVNLDVLIEELEAEARSIFDNCGASTR